MGQAVITDNTSIKISAKVETRANASGNRDLLVVTTSATESAKVKVTYYNGTGAALTIAAGTSSATVSPTIANTVFYSNIAANTTLTHDFEVGPSTTFYVGIGTNTASAQVYAVGTKYVNSP